MTNLQTVLEKLENSSIFSDIEIVENVTVFHSRNNHKVNGYKVSMIDEWEEKKLLGLDIQRPVEDFEFTPFCNKKEGWESAYTTELSSVLFGSEEYQDLYGFDTYKIEVSKAIKAYHEDGESIEYIFCIENIEDIYSC